MVCCKALILWSATKDLSNFSLDGKQDNMLMFLVKILAFQKVQFHLYCTSIDRNHFKTNLVFISGMRLSQENVPFCQCKNSYEV